MRALHCFLITVVAASACADLDSAPSRQDILDDAQQSIAARSKTDAKQAFYRDFRGLWRAKIFDQGAWVDLIWVVGRDHAWHVVTAYADENFQTRLLRWDIVRRYHLEQPTALFPRAYEMLWTDRASWLTPYVDDPGLFEAVGLDDCELEVGVSAFQVDNCGAPLFPFRDCDLMDFVALQEGQMTFGNPRQGDRCEQRPTEREQWFDRVEFTPELAEALFQVR